MSGMAGASRQAFKSSVIVVGKVESWNRQTVEEDTLIQTLLETSLLSNVNKSEDVIGLK